MDVTGFALITGAASGIGKACAHAFALEGSAGIALVDINETALLDVKSKIVGESRKRNITENRAACQILTYVIDVTKEEDVNRVVDDVAKIFGRLDYVVNAAGVAASSTGGAACLETHDWNRVIDINLNGTLFVQRASVRVMLKQDPILSSIDERRSQRGSIINFASILGVVGTRSTTAYTASKHAIVGLTKSASQDYAQDGLRINAICPGWTDTPMTSTVADPEIAKAIEYHVNLAPMRRMGLPQEIADGVLFLAGGRSSFITGSTLMVDGGYTSL